MMVLDLSKLFSLIILNASDSNSDIIAPIVIGIIIIVLLVVIVILCLCTKTCNKADSDTSHSSIQTSGLIPPIYYTDSLQDPLMQDDLKENVKIPSF